MAAIFKRELRAYFTSPLGYIITLIFIVAEGVFFSLIFASGTAQIESLFLGIYNFTLFLVPVLTMKLFSEERRMKTDQVLFTAPVKLSGVVLGKYFAAFTVFLISNFVTLIYQIILSVFAESVDWAVYLCSLIGLWLLASAFIAVGMFISSLTENQMTSALGSMLISILVIIVDSLGAYIKIEFLYKLVSWFSFSSRYNTFVNGIFDYANVAFFLSITAVFLFLTVRVQEKRRWA